MKITIVIITKNRLNYLKTCINSINRQNRYPSNLIIVDGSDNDATKDYIDYMNNDFKLYDITYVKPNKQGTSTARNIGASLSDGQITVFLDDDTVLSDNYVHSMEKLFDSDKKMLIGGATGRIHSIKSNQRGSFTPFEKLFRHIFLIESGVKGIVLPSGFATDLPESGETEWLSGSNMAFRDIVLAEFTFDESLEKYSSYALGEDLDYSIRVGKKFKLMVVPDARLEHIEEDRWHDGADSEIIRLNFLKVVNHHYIIKKNADKSIKAAFYWAIIGFAIGYFIKVFQQQSKSYFYGLIGLFTGCKFIIFGK